MSHIHDALTKAEQEGSTPGKKIIPAQVRPERQIAKPSDNSARVHAPFISTRRVPPRAVEDSQFDVFEPLRILYRRRHCLYICTAAMFVVAAFVCVFMPPKYVAYSRLQLLNQQTGRLSLGDGADNGDGFDFFATLQTNVTVMQSDTLALEVIKELNLADVFGYNPLIKTKEVRRQMALPLDQAPLKRAAILYRFQTSLNVGIVPGSRLITVSYTDSDPELAARIVNRLVSDFVEHNFEVRYDATMKATDFLSRQLVDLKGDVEKSQQRVVELQKASGMIGADENHNIIATRLEQLNNEVVAAETNRVAKEAVYNLARNGNPELVAGLVGSGGTTGPGPGSEVTAGANRVSKEAVYNLARNGNPGLVAGLLGASTNGTSASATSAGAASYSPEISHLRQEEADLNMQYAQAATQYGPAYPRLIQLKEQMAALQASIQSELSMVVERAKSDYELAASQEATAKRIFTEQEAIASKMNDQAIAFTIAKNEADSSRVLYDNLLQKLKEAGVLAGLHSSDLNIVDPAGVPGARSRPRIRLYLGIGLLAGLALGVLGGFVLEALDHTVRNPEEIETTTQTPLLGVIPEARISKGTGAELWLSAYGGNGHKASGDNGAKLVSRDTAAVAEAFRWVRTSLLLPQGGETPKVFMIASAAPQEGKSFAALNLAGVLAQEGKSVLLVDADLRRGTLSKVVGHDSGEGLSELLLGSIDHVSCPQIGEVAGLLFMPSGVLLTAPGELLASPKMAELMESWRREFTYVVIDTPPILPVSDAVVLSPRVDSVIVVARSAFTQRGSISRAIRILRNAQVKNISVLVNAVDARSPEYSHFYGSYGYESYQAQDPRLLTVRPSKPNFGKEST